jgi:hypothetical protein
MIDEDRLRELEKEDLVNRWQLHRQRCLGIAVKLGATSPEQAIEFAEKIGSYILNGVSKKDGPV